MAVEYVQADLNNHALLREALTGRDIVFHLISTTIPKTSNDDPLYDIESNLIETVCLLGQCVESRVRKVVFLSSGGTIYGIPHSLPVSEESPTNPECSYGIVKLAIEKYLRLFYKLHGLEYVVVRPSNPYGPRQNPLGLQGAVSVFLGQIARGQAVTVWGDGQIVRDYIFIEDLIDGIYQAAIRGTLSRIYNIGSGQGRSLNDLIDIMGRVAERPVRVVRTAGRSFDVPAIFLDIRRAGADLGWQPRTSLENGIKRTWDFIRQNAGRGGS